MSANGTCLVTGANGFIGSHLVDHLLSLGRPVRALVRAGSDRRWLDERAETAVGDVRDALSLARAARGVSVVFHVAGVVASHRPRDYHDVNAAGTRSLVRAVEKEAPDVRRFVLVSSLAAAGPSPDGRPVRETDAPRPVSLYGRSKLAGERAAAVAAADLPLTVVRPPVVYGPRDREMLTFFQIVARGVLPALPREKYYSLIHVRDLVRGIALAAEAPIAEGRTYHLAAGRSVAMSHYLSLIARELGVAPRRVPVPLGIVPLLSAAADAVAPALGLRVRPLRDKARELRPDFWVADSARARAELGFAARVGLEEGIRETVRFYREKGWVPSARAVR